MHRLTYKDNKIMRKSSVLINIRGSIRKMEKGDVLTLDKGYNIRVVRSAASDIATLENKEFSVAAPRESDVIKVTRIS